MGVGCSTNISLGMTELAKQTTQDMPDTSNLRSGITQTHIDLSANSLEAISSTPMISTRQPDICSTSNQISTVDFESEYTFSPFLDNATESRKVIEIDLAERLSRSGLLRYSTFVKFQDLKCVATIIGDTNNEMISTLIRVVSHKREDIPAPLNDLPITVVDHSFVVIDGLRHFFEPFLLHDNSRPSGHDRWLAVDRLSQCNLSYVVDSNIWRERKVSNDVSYTIKVKLTVQIYFKENCSLSLWQFDDENDLCNHPHEVEHHYVGTRWHITNTTTNSPTH